MAPQLPVTVVELLREFLQSEFFQLWEHPKASDPENRDTRVLPYDLLQLALVNKTFYRVFMSDKAWSQFGSGTDIAQHYLKLKHQVDESVWNHDRLWELAPLLPLYSSKYREEILSWPLVFRALLQAINHSVDCGSLDSLAASGFLDPSQAEIYDWSQGRIVKDGIEIDNPLVDKEFYLTWQKNSHPKAHTLDFINVLPQALQTKEFALELLSLGMLPNSTWWHDKAVMFACLAYKYFENTALEYFDEPFSEYIFEDPALYKRRMAIDCEVLCFLPPRYEKNKKFWWDALDLDPSAYYFAPLKLRTDTRYVLKAMNVAWSLGCSFMCWTKLNHERMSTVNNGDEGAHAELKKIVRAVELKHERPLVDTFDDPAL